MNCFKCGKTLKQSGGLFRVNEKDTPSIFGCIDCIPEDKKQDVNLKAITSAAQKENKATH